MWWEEEDFSRHLLAFLCRDKAFLKKFGGLLTPEDFKTQEREKYLVAQIGLGFWKKHKVPVGGMLRMEALSLCEEKGVTGKRQQKVMELVGAVLTGAPLQAVEAMEEKVQKYLQSKVQDDAIEEILEAKEAGKLTGEYFATVCRKVVQWEGAKKSQAEDLMSETALVSRIVRREKEIGRKRPLLFIDELDEKTWAIGKGDLGIVLGPLKKGKSMMLAHLAIAYAKQKLNVLYVSLEDPREEVEDRFDASIAGIAIERLSQMPVKLKKRWKKFSRPVLGRIRMVDGTGEKFTVQKLESVWEELREEGFDAQVVIVDYDKYLETDTKMRSKLEEWDIVYKDFRRFGAKHGLYLWTAAQTQRLGDTVKVISSDKAGEDIGKIQKATMVIGIGQGEEHPDARYLYVTAHKRGRSRFGVTIISSPEMGLFYDRERTWKLLKKAKGEL